RLGVGIVPSHMARRLRRAVGLPEAEGLLVRFVEEGSPAEAAGIQQGDLIVGAGGEPVTNADELLRVLDGLQPGTTVELELLRGTDERSASVTLTAG
ncbi:MAG TPA: PDZ domain-containing protein, partial [Actinomycetota bacterium]|nr:PDZ domain-containing protein [Actinomycetota bacterium]